jgi:hypothetical protein
MQNSIFLAHSSQDKDRVRAIYHTLKTMGFEPWMDESGLPPGVEWERQIQAEIKKAKLFMICFSDQVLPAESYVHTEIRLALKEVESRAVDIPYIIPLLLDDVPIASLNTSTYKLSKYQAIRYFQPDGKEKLLSFLNKFLKVNLAAALEPQFAKIKQLIGQARLDTAIKDLENIINTDPRLELFQNPALMLKQQHAKLKSDDMMGVISYENANIERNRIVQNLLKLLNEVSGFSKEVE